MRRSAGWSRAPYPEAPVSALSKNLRRQLRRKRLIARARADLSTFSSPVSLRTPGISHESTAVNCLAAADRKRSVLNARAGLRWDEEMPRRLVYRVEDSEVLIPWSCRSSTTACESPKLVLYGSATPLRRSEHRVVSQSRCNGVTDIYLPESRESRRLFPRPRDGPATDPVDWRPTILHRLERIRVNSPP